MSLDLRDQAWLLDTGNHPQPAAAVGTGLNIDRKHPLEALSPTHRRPRLVVVYPAPGALRHNSLSILEVRRKYAVEAGQVQSRPGYERRQPGHEIQWFEHHMGRTIPEWAPVAVDHAPLAVDRQTLHGNGRAAEQADAPPVEPYNEVLMRGALDLETGEEIQVREILFAPGWTAPRHYHNSDLFIYVIAGEFEVDMEGAGLKTYMDGQVLRMRPNTPMDARNSSDVNPLKLAVFQVGNPDSAFVVPIDE